MTDAEYPKVIRLQLRKPKSWEWQLSTSKSSPRIILPVIELYNSKGQLLLEARDNGDAQRRIWHSSTIENKELHPNAKKESEKSGLKNLKRCKSDTFNHNSSGDVLRNKYDSINRRDRNRQPNNKIKSSGTSLDNTTTNKTADILRGNGKSASNATKATKSSVKTSEIPDNCLRKSKSDAYSYKDDLSSKDNTLKRHSAQSFSEFVQNAQARYHRRSRSGDLFGRKVWGEESIKRAELDGYRNFITPNIPQDKSRDERDTNKKTSAVAEKASLDNNASNVEVNNFKPKQYKTRTCSAGTLIIGEESFNSTHRVRHRHRHRDSGIGDESVRMSMERQGSYAQDDARKSNDVRKIMEMDRHGRQTSDPTESKSKNYAFNRYLMASERTAEKPRERDRLTANRINPNPGLFYSHSDVFPFHEKLSGKIDEKLTDSCNNYIVEEPNTPSGSRKNSESIIEDLNGKKRRRKSDGSTYSNTVETGGRTKVPLEVTNMWMHYSSENWPKVEDIDSAIERLSHELYNLNMDALHAMNYDLNACFDVEEVCHIKIRSEKYCIGANICNQYTHGVLNLEEFCEKIIDADLKYFLYGVKKYLPMEIIEKYQLNDDDDDKDSEEMCTN